MIDRFDDPLLTPAETARHLRIPPSTISYWLGEEAAGAPLVHRVTPAKRGWPSIPFVAIVEAYVLRSLRELGLKKSAIRDAAAAVREEFDTPYGLAAARIATDGIDIFIEHAGELRRAWDGQTPMREVIADYLRYITWDESDGWPKRLLLRQYPDVAPVVIDPRFGWGAPVLAQNKVPIAAIVDLWRAGEPMEAVADEYELTRDVVEAICRVAAA